MGFRNRTAWSGRPLLFAALAIVAMANALAPQAAIDIADQGLIASAANLFGISAVFWFAGYALWTIARTDDDSAGAAPGGIADGAVLAIVALLVLAPFPLLSAIALLLLACWLQRTSRRGEATRRIAFILFALTGALLWGKLVLATFAAPVLALDGAVVRLLSDAQVEGNLMRFSAPSPNFKTDMVMIARGCSSVRNLSLAVVIWACLVQLFALRLTPRLVIACLAAMLAMLLINGARLAAIASYPLQFDMLHTGFGATLFGWAALIAAALIAGIAVARELRHQPAAVR